MSGTPKEFEAYNLEPEEVMKHFGTDPVKGLTDEQVKANAEKYGRNTFPPPEKKSILSMILEQFQDKMVIVLFSLFSKMIQKNVLHHSLNHGLLLLFSHSMLLFQLFKKLTQITALNH